MKIKLILSMDPNGYIGNEEGLVWSCNKDFKHFKQITTGTGTNAIVMGRKTYEQIGKPLPNRLNIVLSKQLDWHFDTSLKNIDNCHKSMSIYDVLLTCEEQNIDNLWVIGGKEIYEQFFELADEVIITKYDQYSDKDDLTQYLPDMSQFVLTDSITGSDTDIHSYYPLTYTITYWHRML